MHDPFETSLTKFYSMHRIFRKLIPLIPALLLLASCRTHEPNISHDVVPAHAFDGILSTNWLVMAKAALPAKYLANGIESFQKMTNLLCQESRRGNNAAKGLWGIALLTQSRSPQEAKTGLELLRSSADKGYIPAMFNLGLLYENGKFVQADSKEAFHWFSVAADRGYSEAQLHMAGCYHFGVGTTPDLAMAAKWYRRAAEQTNYAAMKDLGYFLMEGMGLDKDLDAAKYWFTRAAKEGGNPRAMYNLGVLCRMKSPQPAATAEAFQWFKRSAELGDPLASYWMSVCYYHGWGVESNLDNYHDWRFKAATLGSTEAEFSMGSAYRTGDGVPKDAESSLMWYRKSAAKNDPRAFYDLSLHYLDDKTNQASMALANDYMLRAAQAGHRDAQFQCAMSCFRRDVGAPDFESGKQWLAKAAENGWGRAEYFLFQCYFNGAPPGPGWPSYPKDSAEAIKWIRRAAQHDNLQAQAVLAVMLIRGTDMKQDKTEAETLLRGAAEHGYASAQNDLGFAILNGDLSTTNLVEAAMWCRLAESGATDTKTLQRAKVNFSNVWSRLGAVEQSEVDRRVKHFNALPVPVIDPMVKDWERNPDYQQENGHLGR